MPHASFPYGGLISDPTGNLYGTTYFGGKNGDGSVFRLTNSNGKWKESLLYSFKDGKDGSFPTSTLVFDANGNLYGTTSSGGDSNGDGVVFKLTSISGGKWKESTLTVSITLRTEPILTTDWCSTKRATFMVQLRLGEFITRARYLS